MHAYADRVYIHKLFRVHVPGIRQDSNRAPDGAGAAFEAAVNSAQAVAPISALGPAGRGSGHSASDWGARQRKWHAGLALALVG